MKNSQLKQLIKEEIHSALNEGHLSKMLGVANLKFGKSGNLYYIVGHDSYLKTIDLHISKKDLPKFFEMVRNAEIQYNKINSDMQDETL